MNGAYLHLLINHIPVILAPLGTGAAILAIITGKRAIWLYAVACLALSGLSAYPVMATGDLAADVVRDEVPGVSRNAINDHKDAGETTMWILIAEGVVAAYAWWRLARMGDDGLRTWVAALLLVGGLAATGMVTYTSVEGGYIIHTEAHRPSPPVIAKPQSP